MYLPAVIACSTVIVQLTLSNYFIISFDASNIYLIYWNPVLCHVFFSNSFFKYVYYLFKCIYSNTTVHVFTHARSHTHIPASKYMCRLILLFEASSS